MGDYDCSTCGDKKEIRGCLEDAPIPIFELDGKKYYRCPIQIIKQDKNYHEINSYINYYNFLDKGFFLEKGGLINQSNIYYEVMTFIMQEIERKTSGNK